MSIHTCVLYCVFRKLSYAYISTHTHVHRTTDLLFDKHAALLDWRLAFIEAHQDAKSTKRRELWRELVVGELHAAARVKHPQVFSKHEKLLAHAPATLSSLSSSTASKTRAKAPPATAAAAAASEVKNTPQVKREEQPKKKAPVPAPAPAPAEPKKPVRPSTLVRQKKPSVMQPSVHSRPKQQQSAPAPVEKQEVKRSQPAPVFSKPVLKPVPAKREQKQPAAPVVPEAPSSDDAWSSDDEDDVAYTTPVNKEQEKALKELHAADAAELEVRVCVCVCVCVCVTHIYTHIYL
jgi:outer membrane biosynthesis protein TonB